MSHIKRRDFINGSAVAIAGSLSGASPRFSRGSAPSKYPLPSQASGVAIRDLMPWHINTPGAAAESRSDGPDGWAL